MTTTSNPKIGRFPILKPLGRGAQGAVYLALDPDLRRKVAIKVIAEAPVDADSTEGGWVQASLLAQLRHPNIVALHELGRFQSFTYLVFEHLEGTPLREELTRSGALPLARAYSTLLQVADAMAYAHTKDILHLDLNPNNIMRDDADKPRIMDFDLSRKADAPADTSHITGTLPYLAPEYFGDRVLDKRTDVYALGQMLYEVLTGLLPVPAGDDAAMAAHILTIDSDPVPLQQADPQGHFAAVVRRATRKDRMQRYADAAQLRDALVAAWNATSGGRDGAQAEQHGTVSFVLRRIERRGDFPAISRTLSEVNKLTTDESQSSVGHLSAVILRDYALTNRLLKLANSSHYARLSGKVNTVTDAINRLGSEQVRLTCNGLVCFGHFGAGKEGRLREETVAAFIAGLLTRHLCGLMNFKQSEEAFLGGMLLTLGRMIALYYFNEEFEEITVLIAGGAEPDEAQRTVMGITLAELGHAVGSAWGLPAVVLSCMLEAPGTDDALAMRAAARFANALVAVDAAVDPDGALITRQAMALAPRAQLGLPDIHGLVVGAMDRFKAFAPALELDLSTCACVGRIDRWAEQIAQGLDHPVTQPV